MPHRRIGISKSLREHYKQSPEWCELSDADLDRIDAASSCKEYDAGEILFQDGDDCLGVYFIHSGLVGVRKTSFEGESTLLRLAFPNDTLGYRPLLASQTHRAAAEALKPSVVCLISADVVMPMIRENPTLGLNFLHRATVELGLAEERFHNTVTLSLRARFAQLLLIMKDRCGSTEEGKMLLDLPISRGEGV